jgi:O-antigen biosynthesis protein
MKNSTVVRELRDALDQHDAQMALMLLEQASTQRLPPSLLRPLLQSCHPGLDTPYLNLDLVPAPLLLACRFPELLIQPVLDWSRVWLCHRVDPNRFVRHRMNLVLRGEQPLYINLPAIELRFYQSLLPAIPSSAGHTRPSALEQLACEPDPDEAIRLSPLHRWASSSLDSLLHHPLLWIHGPGQCGRQVAFALPAGLDGWRQVDDLESAAMLLQEACRMLLQGGGQYLLWNGQGPPPSTWIPVLLGAPSARQASPQQLLATPDGGISLQPMAQPGPASALLILDARWLARRQPRQLLCLLHHWLQPGSLAPAVGTVGVRQQRQRCLRHRISSPRLLRGLLVMVATSEQIRDVGWADLSQRCDRIAQLGGFERAALIQVDYGQADPGSVQQQLLCHVSDQQLNSTMIALIGPDDQIDAQSWLRLSQYASWHSDPLLCSDEELCWSDVPRRVGQRQFAGSVTPFRLLTRGHLPGLVMLPVKGLLGLPIQPHYHSLHGLLRDVALHWLSHGHTINTLPQALLQRAFFSNPSVLGFRTTAQVHPFTSVQLEELDCITERHKSRWLCTDGDLVAGTIAGTYRFIRRIQSSDLVSVVIPFRNGADLTRQCILSLLKHAGNTPLELVLVDNDSSDSDAVGLADELSMIVRQHGHALISIRDESPFNYASLNNKARHYCNGNFLLFLNNDIVFKSFSPLEDLLAPFGSLLTGAVSSRLLFEDGTLQHHGLAAAARQPHDILSPGKGLQPGPATDPFLFLNVQEQWSAATAACLLIRTDVFDRLGGFDECFSVAYNDVDLCWRMHSLGLVTVVIPEPVIIHAESKSRGDDTAGAKRNRLAFESGNLRQRYPRYFDAGDPLYHCLLDQASQRFTPSKHPPTPSKPAESKLKYIWVTPGFRRVHKKPLLIYAHWDPQPAIRTDIFDQLSVYRQFADVIFVSATPSLLHSDLLLQKLKKLSVAVLVRCNEGYDFGSWKAAIDYFSYDVLNSPWIILANDSCYGPVQAFDAVFDALKGSHADVIGLTGSTSICSHLQSYFIAYKSTVVRSPLFSCFWNSIGCWSSKLDLVAAHEIGWSAALEAASYRLEALFLPGEHGNITHTHWRKLIQQHAFPFIKVELLMSNPILQDINGWPELIGSYNSRLVPLIYEHLSRLSRTK